jgi:tetratricopeptide (TPR) repeat protein
MVYIQENSLGQQKIFAPFIPEIQKTILSNIDFPIEITTNPYTYRPDITFLCDFSYQYVEGLGKLVNIGHGTIAKGWFYSSNPISQRENCCDLLCVPGDIHREKLSKQLTKPIAVTGMPKLDRCFDGSLDRVSLLRKWGLNPEQKTILLAPTFNDEFSILPFLRNVDLTKIFPQYINLIVKLHGVSDNGLKQQFYNFKNQNKYVHIVDNFDTDDLFFVADLLISDVSSVIYEFLSTGKPVMLFDSPHQQTYINYDQTDLEWQYREVGDRFTDVYSIPQLIFKNLTSAGTSPYSSIGYKFISVRDGSSSRHVITAALDLLKSPKKSDMLIVTDKKTTSMVNSWENRYDIVESSQPTFAAMIENAKRNSLHSTLLYFKSGCAYSPLMTSFIENHLRNTHNACVVPLIDDNELTLQTCNARVSLSTDLNFTQKAIQLGYALTYQAKPIDYFLPHCFAIDKKTLLEVQFSDPYNTNLCVHELITHIVKKGSNVQLAYDCLISPNSQPGGQNSSTHSHSIKHREENSKSAEDLLLPDLNNEKSIQKFVEELFEREMWDQVDAYSDMIPNNLYTRYLQLKSYEKQGLTKEALNLIEKLELSTISDLSLFVKFMILKARLMMMHNRTDEVLLSINVALQFEENNLEALLCRAIYYLTNNILDKAVVDLDLILSIEPNHVKALSGYAMIYESTQMYTDALKCYNRILNIEQDNLEAIHSIHKYAWITKDFNNIVEILNAYLSRHPDDKNMLFTLSGILYEIKQYTRSKQLLERLLSLDPNFEGARALLEKIGDRR